jgi:hypothetical protein
MPPVPPGPWFNAIARHLGPAYLRNAFTKRSDRLTRSITGIMRGRRAADTRSRMANLLIWVVAVGSLAQGSLQFLAAVGRVDLDTWPFVASDSRRLRLAAAAWEWAFGLVAPFVAVSKAM